MKGKYPQRPLFMNTEMLFIISLFYIIFISIIYIYS